MVPQRISSSLSILACLALLALAGCGGEPKSPAEEQLEEVADAFRDLDASAFAGTTHGKDGDVRMEAR